MSQNANKDLRITLIDSTGAILYDSDAEAGKMENHNDRKEVIDAFAKGFGEDLRYSSTLQAKTIPYLIALLGAIIVAAILIAIGLSCAFH